MNILAPDSQVEATGQSGRVPSRKFLERRDEIIRSAVIEINRRGVRGMTIGHVAARLGLVPTAVIYYFKNKEELAAAAFAKTAEQYSELAALAADGKSARERISSYIQRYFELRKQIELGQKSEISVFNDLRALKNESLNNSYVQMFKDVRRLFPIIEGVTRADRNGRVVYLLGVVNFSRAWLFNWRVDDYQRVAGRMSHVLLDGVAARRGALPPAMPIDLLGESHIGTETPEHFLRAATQLINDEGYHGASVDRISAHLKVTKGAFYHYNTTKDELVLACFQRTFDLLWRAIDAAETAGGSGLQVLVSLLTAVVTLQQGDAPLLRTTALSTVPIEIHGHLLEKLRRITIRLASILCDGIADGSIRPIDTTIAAQVITAAINTASELKYWQPADHVEERVGRYVESVLLGVL